ncbi:UNVERIFIED_CONTAM: Retrovirus-related Pol polyprotein from transposon TNT 1-94 [Sesamum latifolium]|uniref:Retrovirus-related Pol polyprotein from transposon TNT 1-94 n=1 Tax=Sesamum latifolium TaxID=2727402 RepID=A0AAW2TQA3_9LAMI
MISNSASWVLDNGCGAHICNDLQVLERSRRLTKDEMILRLGDGKAVAAEAVGSLRLVVSNHIRIDLKDCYLCQHGKPASYKYLRVWGSPGYVKRLVEDKLDSRSSLCRFIGYPKETAGYYFYDLTKQKIFVSRNAVFLKKGFPSDNRRDEVLIEESSEKPHHDSTTSFEPTVHTDGVPVLHRSTRESRVPERYGFVGLTSQLDNDPKTYEEAMSDIDSNKWLEAMKSKMDLMDSNQVWTLVDPPKGARPVGCKWVYKRKLGANGEVMAFKARLMVKGYTQRPGVDFEETFSPVVMAKSIQILLAIAAWYDYKYGRWT